MLQSVEITSSTNQEHVNSNSLDMIQVSPFMKLNSREGLEQNCEESSPEFKLKRIVTSPGKSPSQLNFGASPGKSPLQLNLCASSSESPISGMMLKICSESNSG